MRPENISPEVQPTASNGVVDSSYNGTHNSNRNNNSVVHKKRTGKIALVGGATAALLLGGGALAAYNVLGSSSDYPFDHISGDAAAYVQLNVDPSVSQKLALNNLSKKFPDVFKKGGPLTGEAQKNPKDRELSKDELVGDLIGRVLKDGKDYSWVGDRIGVAAYEDNDNDGNPEFAVVFSVDDESKAKSNLKNMINEMNAGKDFNNYPTSGRNGEISGSDKITGTVNGEWMVFTNGDVKKISTNDKTLADRDDFSSKFDDFKGNVVGGWSSNTDLNKFAKKYSEEDSNTKVKIPDVSGHTAFGLKARNDGLDLTAKTFNVKFDGKVPGYSKDKNDLARLVENNSYKNSVLNFGLKNFGENVEMIMKDNPELGSNLGFSIDTISSLLGNGLSLSVAGGSLDELNIRLVLSGVDEKTWQEFLNSQGVSVDELEAKLKDTTQKDSASLSLKNNEFSLTLGDRPSGGVSLENGIVTGVVDLDGVEKLFNDFSNSFGGDQTEYKNHKYGKINFDYDVSSSGDGEGHVSWSTRR